MFVLDKKVIVYKVTYRVRAQLCEEKNVQKEILRNVATRQAVVSPKGTDFFSPACLYFSV